jgi:Ca2+-binding RTX toxin-like protein
VVYGMAGDDEIKIQDKITVPGWLYGGDGNDLINSGNTDSVLMGGAGYDELHGGKGRNLSIGGTGKDKLKSNAGDDLLIGGYTDYDSDEAALNALLREWSRTDGSYAQRVDHLLGRAGGGLNGPDLLTSSTVHDDGAENQLTGGAGTDFYFAGFLDKLTGKKKDESVFWI